jgi:predicted TIM-barrel fold metal-dependent hydrolase
MRRRPGKFVTVLSLSAAGIAVLGFAAHASLAQQSQASAAKMPSSMEPVPATTPFIEEHAHFDETDPAGSVRAAMAAMGRENAAIILFQISPDTFDHPGRYDSEVILAEVKKHPGKLAMTGGGGSLNAMIVQSVKTGDAGPEVQKKFKARAEELLRKGVIGFGEMTAEHFAGYTPYQFAPPDHPLYFLLADLAAEHDVPIDLHMEAVPEDMALPPDQKSPPNAPRLHANIAAFERLLAHNPRAKIIWAHLGSDFTGFRTVELDRRLLATHPNLYMEIKTDPDAHGLNYPLAADGKLKADWSKLFTDFPDRFVIGSDQHYPEPKDADKRWQQTILLFNQLPADVRKKIGTENVARIYGNAVASSLRAAKN